MALGDSPPNAKTYLVVIAQATVALPECNFLLVSSHISLRARLIESCLIIVLLYLVGVVFEFHFMAVSLRCNMFLVLTR